MAEYDANKRYVLFAREKSGERFLDATTEEAFHRSAVKLLRGRLEEGGYEYLKSDGLKKPDLTKEQVAELPEGEVKKTAQRQRKDYCQALRENSENDRLHEEIVEAVEKKDGSDAWDALKRCSDGEYDWVELEELET